MQASWKLRGPGERLCRKPSCQWRENELPSGKALTFLHSSSSLWIETKTKTKSWLWTQGLIWEKVDPDCRLQLVPQTRPPASVLWTKINYCFLHTSMCNSNKREKPISGLSVKASFFSKLLVGGEKESIEVGGTGACMQALWNLHRHLLTPTCSSHRPGCWVQDVQQGDFSIILPTLGLD